MASLLFCAAAVGGPLMALELPSYEVLASDGDFELRRYDGSIVAETYVEGSFEGAGNEGFRRLADYIFGNNRSRRKLEMTAPATQTQSSSQKIAMTAPVSMHRAGNKYRVTFMMPSEHSLDTLPEPVNPEVRLRQEPGKLMAAVRYSGTWSQRRYAQHQAALQSWIAGRGWRPSAEAIFARYDPPFKPWFLRRNEILVTIEEAPSP